MGNLDTKSVFRGTMVHVVVLRANMVESKTGKRSQNQKSTTWTKRLQKRSLDLPGIHTLRDRVCCNGGFGFVQSTKKWEVSSDMEEHFVRDKLELSHKVP